MYLARWVLVFLALMLCQPRAAFAQASDPRWGVLAELAEQDFHVGVMMGSSMLHAFRWEDPGRQLSLTWSYGLQNDKTLMTLDEATGEIVLVSAYAAQHGEKYAVRAIVDPEGAILVLPKRAIYARKRPDGSVELRGGKLVPTTADTNAGRKAAKLIAKGELRPPNPALRGAAPSSGSVGAPAATTTAAAAPPPVGAEMTQVQRDALDRYVKAGWSIHLGENAPGHGQKGWSFFASEWEEPGKTFVTRVWHETADVREVHYEVRSDGAILVAPRSDADRALGLAGKVDPSGKITFEWSGGGKNHRTEVTDWANVPGGVALTNYSGVARPNQSPQWTKVSSANGVPMSAENRVAAIARFRAMGAVKTSPWGALSLLPGTLWYCVGYEPEQWLGRRRTYQGEVGLLDESVPAMRLTVAAWRDPERTLEVITKLGDGRGWTDVITLQPDGSLSMTSTGVSRYATLVGRKNEWGAVVFPMGRYTPSSETYQNAIVFMTSPYQALAPNMSLFVDANRSLDPASCDMKPFDKDKLPEWTAELAKEQRQIAERIQGRLNARQEFAADRAAGQQMIAGMQADLIGAVLGGGGSGPVAYSPQSTRTLDGESASPFLQDLRNMADIAQREAERSRHSLQATIAAGGQDQPTPATSSAAAPVSQSPDQPAATTAKLTLKSARAYFWVGMTPTPTSTRNPSCYSSPFQIQFEHEANGWGDNGRAQAALKQYEANFIAKCSRHGQVNGVVNGNVEGLTSGFPIPAAHAEDFVVQMP